MILIFRKFAVDDTSVSAYIYHRYNLPYYYIFIVVLYNEYDQVNRHDSNSIISEL